MRLIALTRQLNLFLPLASAGARPLT